MADENIGVPILERLRADGVSVLHVTDIAPTISDSEVLRLAAEHNAIVLTDDKDFGELVVREGRTHRGVVLLRLAGVAYAKRAEMVSALFASAARRSRERSRYCPPMAEFASGTSHR